MTDLSLASTKSAVVIVFDNIGDVIFTSPVFSELSKIPGLRLGVWCKNYTEQIARLLPGEPEVFASDTFWDKSPLRGKGRFLAFVKKALELRRKRFDIAIIPNHCWRSALVARLIGIPVRIGFGHGKNLRFLTHPVPKMERDKPVVPQMLRLLTPFRDFSMPFERPVYRLVTPKEAVTLKNPFLMPPKSFVILHPFAGSAKRCASLSLWLQFGLALKEAGFKVLWLGARTELERLKEHRDRFGSEEFGDYYEANGLGDYAAIMAKAYAYVGHDSGPLHYAHGLGAPAFGLYLPSEYQRTFPQGPVPSHMLHRSSPEALTLDDWLSEWRSFQARALSPLS